MPSTSAMRTASALDLRVRALARPQHETVHRSQLAASGVSWEMVESQVAAGRWQPVGPLVIVLHNGPLTRTQQLWAAVLTVGAKGCLAEGTALEVHGFRGLGVPDLETVHVLHPRASSIPTLSWLVVHESRRLRKGDIILRKGLAVTGPGRAAIDRAAWQPHPRFAYAVLAAVVQQQLARVEELSRELRRAGQVPPRRAHAAGARGHRRRRGGTERDRPVRGLPSLRAVRAGPAADPRRPSRRTALSRRGMGPARRDDSGPRGRWLTSQTVEHWQADMRRERRVVVGRRRSTVLRCTAAELRLAPVDLVQDLRDAGVPPLHPVTCHRPDRPSKAVWR